jgi:hypothetical protein
MILMTMLAACAPTKDQMEYTNSQLEAIQSPTWEYSSVCFMNDDDDCWDDGFASAIHTVDCAGDDFGDYEDCVVHQMNQLGTDGWRIDVEGFPADGYVYLLWRPVT